MAALQRHHQHGANALLKTRILPHEPNIPSTSCTINELTGDFGNLHQAEFLIEQSEELQEENHARRVSFVHNPMFWMRTKESTASLEA